MAYRLEQVRRGEIKRLIINMPPRMLKSITTSVAFSAYVLGLDPTCRFICVSYSGELAKKHSNDFRALVESPGIGRPFPCLSRHPDRAIQGLQRPRSNSPRAASGWRLQLGAH